jgi:lipopolysaccharide export system protein LptA
MFQRLGKGWWLVLLTFGLGIGPLACAQTLGGNVRIDKPFKGFKVAEPYGPPYETRTKSILEGGKGLPLGRSITLLSDGVTLRTFSVTNTPQIKVDCRECFYNSTNREVNSAGPIHMQTADGKFQIEGTGFLWRQTNSSLFISNNVHTLIQSSSFGQGTNALTVAPDPDSGPVTIESGRFSYDGSERGVWRDHVRAVGTNLVSGTNLVLRSDVLTAFIPSGEQRELRSLLAQSNVVVDYHGLHATGAQLTYATDTGLIRITNKARWKEGGKDKPYGSGDELVIDRTNQVFYVNGHAFIHLPSQTMDESGFLSYSNAPVAKSTNSLNRSIEIMSGNYEIHTNWANFRDGVRLDELVGTITNRGKMTSRGHMTSRTMLVTFIGTNQLDTLTADKNVVIEEGTDPDKKRFTGGHAVYTHTNTTLEITQQPRWQAGLKHGKGDDLLRLNTQKSEMLVRSNAELVLPANQLASQLTPRPLTATNNNTANARPVRSGTNEFAQIFSQEYTLRPTNSVFLGGVYATHPEMNWTCENLTVFVPGGGLTNVVAKQNVVFDVARGNQKMHGTGDDAVYTFGLLNTVTNGVRPIDELRLTGTPAVVSNTNSASSNNLAWRNNLIIWNRLTDKLDLPGSNYTIQGMAPAVDTNIFALPKKKLTK